MDITKIIELIIELLLVIATTLIIPWLKEKTDASKRDKILAYVDIAVNAAEQLAKAEGWTGERKKEYVLSYLSQLNMKINYDEVDAMIEAAVINLKKEIA